MPMIKRESCRAVRCKIGGLAKENIQSLKGVQAMAKKQAPAKKSQSAKGNAGGRGKQREKPVKRAK